jgi:hypothetical protein
VLFEEIAADLVSWSRALDVADPIPALEEILEASFDRPKSIEEILEASFDRPKSDPGYRTNELSPGKIPFEVSFSELAPSSLRLDIEPWPNKMSPKERRTELAASVLRIARAAFGAESAERFSEAIAPRMTETEGLRFGAFFGASFDRQGLVDLRIYFEERSGPIFESMTLSRSGSITKRAYYQFPAGHRLDELEPLMKSLDLSHRFSELCASARSLLGTGEIAPGRSIAGVRALPNGHELKMDFSVLRKEWREVEEALRLQLGETYVRWRSAIGNGPLAVVSVRAVQSGTSLNAYVHPYGQRDRSRR